MREKLETLKHHAHTATQFGQVRVFVMYRHTFYKYLAFLEWLQGINGFDEGRFARARWTADYDHFALLDYGGALVKHLYGTIPFGNIFQFNHKDLQRT